MIVLGIVSYSFSSCSCCSLFGCIYAGTIITIMITITVKAQDAIDHTKMQLKQVVTMGRCMCLSVYNIT